MKRLLITGSNRGLGLEFVRQYAGHGAQLWAACRNPDEATALHELATTYPDQIRIVQLDVAEPVSLAAAYTAVRKQTAALDVLINNAGIYTHNQLRSDPDDLQTLGHLDMEQMLWMFRVNAVAPLLIAQQFFDLLKAGNSACIVNITSKMGSIAEKRSGSFYTYSASKAALNMLTRTLAADAGRAGIVAIALIPGWVQTDMGGPGATLTVNESVRNMIGLIDGLKAQDNGRYYNWDGAEQAW